MRGYADAKIIAAHRNVSVASHMYRITNHQLRHQRGEKRAHFHGTHEKKRDGVAEETHRGESANFDLSPSPLTSEPF